MAKSARIRLGDLRSAYRIIGECRDLGSDAARWRDHGLNALCRLFGARVAIGGEMRWHGPDGALQVLQFLECGFTPRQRSIFLEYMRRFGSGDDPILVSVSKLAGRLVTRTRRQLVDDHTWSRSACAEVYHHGTDVDQNLVSLCRFSNDGRINVVCLHRAVGEREFTERQRRLLHVFHDELGRLIGPVLAAANGPGPVCLSPRLRQTLDLLLDGHGEKTIAHRLGLRQATVHQYVVELYRRYAVSGRAELLAHFIRRPRQP
jgi:DNA-binding CsgD family transcriptional regulator